MDFILAITTGQVLTRIVSAFVDAEGACVVRSGGIDMALPWQMGLSIVVALAQKSWFIVENSISMMV